MNHYAHYWKRAFDPIQWTQYLVRRSDGRVLATLYRTTGVWRVSGYGFEGGYDSIAGAKRFAEENLK